MWYGAYLGYRGPLPVISNAGGGVMPLCEFDQPKHGSHYKRAAIWLYQVVHKFLEILR